VHTYQTLILHDLQIEAAIGVYEAAGCTHVDAPSSSRADIALTLRPAARRSSTSLISVSSGSSRVGSSIARSLIFPRLQPVCTENLNPTIVVMQSAQNGA
jgi:hypothetical protein